MSLPRSAAWPMTRRCSSMALEAARPGLSKPLREMTMLRRWPRPGYRPAADEPGGGDRWRDHAGAAAGRQGCQ
jgi:hypothetical protein